MTHRSDASPDFEALFEGTPLEAAPDAKVVMNQAGEAPDPDALLFKLLGACCKASTIAAVGIGILVLFGWTFHIELLKSVLPGLVEMKVNTALGFVFSGTSLWLLIPIESRAGRRRIARLLALLVTLIGAASLAEILSGLNLRIDELFFSEPVNAVATSSPGRMAPMTAMAFLAIGSALLLLDRRTRRGHRPAQLLSLCAALLAMISINGYIYGATALYGVFLGPRSQVALHTAVGFLLLSSAVLLARPQSGIVGDFTGEGSGSVMARRFLPAVLGVPILLGWVCLQGQHAGLYGTEAGVALHASANVIVFSILVWLNARRMNREYDLRSRAEAQLRELNAELERRVAERTKTLEQQAAQLRQAQKMEAIGNLTGGMAHDFNNLLGVVIGNLDLLSERLGSDPDARELVQEALDAALRGADLTRRLLAFARRQPLQPERVDLNELADRISKLLRRTIGENIEFKLELSADIWPVVVDPAQLEASLVNIVNNARDAMPKGGVLTIATSNRSLDEDYTASHPGLAPGDYAMIELSDTGTGIPPEVLNQVFEPFFTTKEQGKGTGLGLSMVFGFMKQSGGHINVYSEVGVGTTFRLYLPRALASAARSATTAPTAFENRGSETILAVEDNAGLRRVVARQLLELGYRVFEAEDGPAALKILESETIDLLLTDIVMPGGMSGYDLARMALKRWPAMKALLTSGFPEAKLNGNGGPPVNMRLLSKPYRKDDLARTLREVLDG
jgi:signal transduction histidine kinase